MRYLIPILLLLLLLSPVAAQGNNNPLTVYRAEDIFTENVTVLEREAIVSYDRSEREIHYFDVPSESWLSFSYPEEFEDVYLAQSYYDSERYIAVLEEHLAPSGLLLDVQTGEYSFAEFYCADYWYPFNDANRWRFVGNELCEYGTGRSIPIPDEALEINTEFLDDNPNIETDYYCNETYNATILMSDQRTLIVPVCTDDTQYLFAYDTETLEFKQILRVRNSLGLFVIATVGNNIVYAQSRSTRSTNINNRYFSLYRIDLTTGEAEEVLEDVNRYDIQGDIWNTNEQVKYNAIEVDEDEIEVYSYDFATGELSEVGEISCEDLEIPCDEIVSLRTSSPTADYVWLQARAEASSDGLNRTQSYLVSVTHHKLVYVTEPELGFGMGAGWLAPNRFYYFYYAEEYSDSLSVKVLDVEEGTLIAERQFEYAMTISPEYVIYGTGEVGKELYAHNLATDARYLLTQLPPEATANVSYRDDGTYTFIIDSKDYPYPLAIWRAEINPVLESE